MSIIPKTQIHAVTLWYNDQKYVYQPLQPRCRYRTLAAFEFPAEQAGSVPKACSPTAPKRKKADRDTLSYLWFHQLTAFNGNDHIGQRPVVSVCF